MSRLDSIRKNLLNMDPEELREHVRQIRRDRRITKEKPAAKVAKRVTGAKAKDALTKLMDSLTPEQREKILRELGNGTGRPTTRQDHDQR